MRGMVDPADALASFQAAFRRGLIDVKQGTLDKTLFVHIDEPVPGKRRISYVRLKGKTVTAFVNFSPADFVDGAPCFQVGVAVPVSYRRKGLAKDAVRAAIAEMKHGFVRAGVSPFWIEAVIHVENVASQMVAEATISADSLSIVDEESGENALQYMLKIEK